MFKQKTANYREGAVQSHKHEHRLEAGGGRFRVRAGLGHRLSVSRTLLHDVLGVLAADSGGMGRLLHPWHVLGQLAEPAHGEEGYSAKEAKHRLTRWI